MDLFEIQLLVRARWKSVLIWACATALLVFVIGLFTVKYQARGSLLLRPLGGESLKLGNQPRIGTVFSENLNIVQQQGISYVHLIKSQPVLRETVLRLGLEKRYAYRRLWIIELIKQPFRLLFYGRLPAVEQTPVDRAVEKLMGRVDVNLVLSSSVMTVTVRGPNARQAADTANTIMYVFQEFTKKTTAGASGDLEKFLDQQLLQTRASLNDAREKSRKLLDDLGLQGVEGVGPELIRLNGRIQALAVRQEDIKWQRETLLNKLAVAEEQMSRWQEQKGSTNALSQNPVLQNLQQHLYEQRIALQRQLADFAEGSVAARSLRDQIAVTEKSITEEVQRLVSAGVFQSDPVWAELYQQKAKAELEIALLPFEEKQNTAMIGYFQKQVKKLEEMRPKFEAIAAAMKPLTQREEEILASQSIAKAYAARGIGEVDIFELAEVPRYPRLKNVPLMVCVILGWIAGGFIPIAVMLLRSAYGRTSQSIRDLAS
jgi:uncharacterized protein involved in exopolysaccharide biosynthesis